MSYSFDSQLFINSYGYAYVRRVDDQETIKYVREISITFQGSKKLIFVISMNTNEYFQPLPFKYYKFIKYWNQIELLSIIRFSTH